MHPIMHGAQHWGIGGLLSVLQLVIMHVALLAPTRWHYVTANYSWHFPRWVRLKHGTQPHCKCHTVSHFVAAVEGGETAMYLIPCEPINSFNAWTHFAFGYSGWLAVDPIWHACPCRSMLYRLPLWHDQNIVIRGLAQRMVTWQLTEWLLKQIQRRHTVNCARFQISWRLTARGERRMYHQIIDETDDRQT